MYTKQTFEAGKVLCAKDLNIITQALEDLDNESKKLNTEIAAIDAEVEKLNTTVDSINTISETVEALEAEVEKLNNGDLDIIANMPIASVEDLPTGAVINDKENKVYSEYSTALGHNTKAGGKGFKIIACHDNGDGTGTYTLSSITGLEVGMNYNVRLSDVAHNDGTINTGAITVIDGNIITVSNYRAINIDGGNDSELAKEDYLTITGRPELGDMYVGFFAVAMGEGSIAQDRSAVAIGREAKAIGQYGFAEGRQTVAAYASHAEGYKTKALANGSHAEGNQSIAYKPSSHAEGCETKAIGENAHSEGYHTVASGKSSHAEGSGSTATNEHAHAEGNTTRANGQYSHSEGWGTIANGTAQHVGGKFNKEDNSNEYAEIIGGGDGFDDKDRKNIRTLDWEGNAYFAGHLTIGEAGYGTEADMNSIKNPRDGQIFFVISE